MRLRLCGLDGYLSEICEHNKILLLFFCFVVCVSCSKDLSFTYVSDEEEWLHALTACELNGRKTGTEGCRKAADYISGELVKMGYSPKLEDFYHRDSIPMRNIIVEIPGDNDSIIIVGAHYDGAVESSKHQAANDNASGVITLLSIAKSIQPDKYTILLCFWDGEESTNGTAFNGSRYFVEHFENLDQVKWYCNIDCCGRSGDSIYLYYSRDMEQKFKDFTIPQNNSLNVMNKVQEKSGSDYVSFRNKGIPFWGWNDYDVLRYIHTPDDSANNISIAKIQTIANLTRFIINGDSYSKCH